MILYPIQEQSEIEVAGFGGCAAGGNSLQRRAN
jgi:hypothetical protein